uniref:SRR1-like protein n=1 Tax=Castor canadensis TaxID=51338 RepID=A0A250XYI4_CASCN|nr:SRR1-like protein [Castor canadensis]
MAAAALDAWQEAAPRRRRAAARGPKRRAAAAAARGPEAEPEADFVLRRLREAEQDLLSSDLWSSAREAICHCVTKQLRQLEAPVGTLPEAFGSLYLDSPPAEPEGVTGCHPGGGLARGTHRMQCVCYGLGNFATCVTARSQLAFLLLFLEECQIPRSHCWVYDPLFSQLETSVLSTLHLAVLRENEEGKRGVSGECTVFYMPHCGTALYNNLLWSNWTPDALSSMLIIGNSFAGLQDRLPTRVLQESYPYIAKVLEALHELPLPQTPRYSDTFNDTSIHWFPKKRLERLPRDLWAFREEPDYQGCEDLEIIRKGTTDPPAVDLNG